MTETNLTELLERAADRTPIGPPPIGRMLAEGKRKRRTVLITGCCAAAAVLAAVTFAFPDNMPSTQSAAGPVTSRTELTPKQYKTAVRLARQQIRKTGATVTSATATISRGTATNPNIGQPCTSGRLLRIKLIGKFPRTVTTGHPVSPGTKEDDFTVHAMVITADARDGQPCLIGVQTGRVAPEPGAVVLDLT